MLLGKVIGTVVATRKEPTLVGLRLLLVRGLDLEGKATGPLIVAADALDAGIGEVVLTVSGSSARQTEVTKDRPIDATVMAIVDEIEISGELRYRKQ